MSVLFGPLNGGTLLHALLYGLDVQHSTVQLYDLIASPSCFTTQEMY